MKALLFILLMANTCFADDIDLLIPAIIQVESGGNPNAVSPAGAIGLMQITPVVLNEYKNWVANEWSKQHNSIGLCNWTMEDMCNPIINKRLGTWYLRYLKTHYLKDKYTIERLLASYNGGITRLRKVNYDISRMPKESRDYVRKVMAIYRRTK